MNIVKFGALVLGTLQTWKEELKPEEYATTPLPVICVPPGWMSKAKEAMRSETDIEAVYGCEVVVDDNCEAPIIIRHDGKTLCLDPSWRADETAIKRAENKRNRRDAKRAREALARAH